jgi:hypothetical protein
VYALGSAGAHRSINYTCPRVGRVIVHATGNLLQQPVATAEGHFVTISLIRNRLTHPPNRVHEYAPPPAGLDEGGYDISIQHAQLCDAFQQVVYRLLANKAFTAPSPAKP